MRSYDHCQGDQGQLKLQVTVDAVAVVLVPLAPPPRGRLRSHRPPSLRHSSAPSSLSNLAPEGRLRLRRH